MRSGHINAAEKSTAGGLRVSSSCERMKMG